MVNSSFDDSQALSRFCGTTIITDRQWLCPTEALVDTYLGQSKANQLAVSIWSQKEREQWGTIPDPTGGIGRWIWVYFSRIFINDLIIFLLSPLRQCQLPHTFPDFLWRRLWRWSQGLLTSWLVHELQKPIDTAAHRWARGQGGQVCLKCLSHTLRAAEPTAGGPINHCSFWSNVILATEIQPAKATWFYHMGH